MGLSDFDLAEELGSGASGRVLRAVHRATDTPVALKLVRPTRPGEALGLDRELAALARLDHPSILHLYDHGVVSEGGAVTEGTHWMALELASAGSLEQHTPADWTEAESWLRVVLLGLAHAHARGLIHRDLKPANLVRCGPTDLRPGLKIADFGLAWALHTDTDGLRRAGSPHYMPPEQISGEVAELGPWSDLYALACVAWEWTTGAPPFGWLDVRPALYAHQHRAPRSRRPTFPVPAGLEPLLRAMLSKDIRDRPPTAAHVLRALDDLEAGFVAHTSPLPVPTGWQSSYTAPSTAVLSGAGLGLFALRDPPIVARQDEQQQLWDALVTVARDRRPAVVALTGTSGIGRRRLARWFRERIAELGCAQIAHAVGVDAYERLANLQVRARRGPTVVDLCGVSPGPEVAELLGAALLDATRTGPVLFLVRGTSDEAWITDLSELAGFRELPLGPMTSSDLASFVHEHLGLARGPAEGVAAGSEGNPGLAVAWVRGWVSRHDLVSTPEGFQLRQGADAAALTDLDDARRAQLDGVLATLDDGPRLALALGALLGTEVRAREWLPLLAEVGLDRRASPVRQLARANLVEPTETGWRILDPAVRLALVDELRRHGEPAQFHEAAAAVLGPLDPTPERRERLGRHLLAAGALDRAWAVLTEVLAQHRAAAHWIDVRAIVELLAASTEVDARSPLDRYTVRYFHVLAVANLQSAAAAVPLVRRALALVPSLDDEHAHRIYRVAAEILGLASHPDEARAVLALTDATHPRMRRVQAMIDLDEGLFEQAIAGHKQVWDETKLRASANGLGVAYALQGNIEEADRWFQACIDETAPSNHVPHCNLALLWLLHGDPTRALAWILQAQDEAERETLQHRGWIAVITAIVGAASGETALVERVRERALFHAQRYTMHDPDQTVDAIETARATAPPEHQELLTLLAARVSRHAPAG